MAAEAHQLRNIEWATLAQRWPHPERLQVAFRLAKDLDTCQQLLDGQPVDPGRLDPAELRKAKQRLLVRLDTHAIDLLTRTAA